MKKIHYLCFFANDELQKDLYIFPSSISKIDYVKDRLIDVGCDVRLVSSCIKKDNGFFRGRKSRVKEKETHIYFSSFNIKNGFLKKINVLYVWLQLFLYILTQVKKGDELLVYHSLFYYRLIGVLRVIFHKRFTLQIEEVYSEVETKLDGLRKKEWSFFQLADRYIVVNDIIKERLNNDKQKIISYGRYDVQEMMVKKEKDTINLIYAGVIEKDRGAAFLAVETMKFLPNNYKLIICGFGNDSNIEALIKSINEMNVSFKEERIVFLGERHGEEYFQILQSCDIALSTHKYDSCSKKSADASFPSKVLVYLSNNLRVVAQSLEVLKVSSVDKFIEYYMKPDPEEIAQTIVNIDLTQEYDSRSFIYELDCKFQGQIKEMLED